MSSSMKLATALKQRVVLRKELFELEKKIKSSLISQVGMKKINDPDELHLKYIKKSQELAKLIASINYTNNITPIEIEIENENDSTIRDYDNIKTINDALICRDRISKKIEFVKFIISAGKEQPLNSKEEIKFVSFIDINKYDTLVQELNNQFEILNLKLQEINWQVDLVEI
ncbi:conserved hypothetical protein [Candida dubliniensis CD36]|uniref:Uncharacterized protein n=1 Tax=Candida dubliniensis (strain CD36 / ATCC MYA-646 / CBS 7987 / NCPF 3949 / NRRL Y-17841) TaxID=573826 RepID=B9WM56_CANDC|nr:conserved hypothetical protein [Candida dubliniensis CD36]CAX40169.1 conserved hypothetical protein [Candida dubliniensis CD36]